MKVLDLGYENSYENFSITAICHIFSHFPAVFHNAQDIMNRHFWVCERNMDLHNYGEAFIYLINSVSPNYHN